MFNNKFLIIIVLSIVLLDFKVIYSKYNAKVSESNKIEYTLNKEINYQIKDDIYDGVLIIPKINLKKGIYKIDDEKNNIEDNIMIHKSSIYPDNDNSNLILIAHSGSGSKAYFKDLDNLDNNSLIEYYYNHTKYIYKIDNIYSVDKIGKVNIKRDKNKKTITLITCDRKNKTKQLVYIGYIIDEIKY